MNPGEFTTRSKNIMLEVFRTHAANPHIKRNWERPNYFLTESTIM